MVTKEEVIAALKDVIDPELGVDIINLGLIYNIEIVSNEKVKVTMTLTTPGCPLYSTINSDMQKALTKIGVKDIDLDLTFEPPWTPEKMSEAAKKLFHVG